MVFRNGGPLRNYEKWYFNGNFVNTVSVYKYIGLLFTPTLSWTSARVQLAKQARKAICLIKQFQKPFGYFTHADIFNYLNV